MWSANRRNFAFLGTKKKSFCWPYSVKEGFYLRVSNTPEQGLDCSYSKFGQWKSQFRLVERKIDVSVRRRLSHIEKGQISASVGEGSREVRWQVSAC